MKASRRLTIVLAGAAATLALGSFAWAAIPGVGGAISGCYDKSSGQLRVTDTATNQPKGCSSKEAAIVWNQQGVPGPQGPQGAAGPSMVYIKRYPDLKAVGTTETGIAALANPFGGQYLLTAKIQIGTFASTGFVTCRLYSADDELDESSATLSSPSPNPQTTLYLTGAIGPNAPSSNMNVQCLASTGGFAGNAVITATQVGTVTFR